MTKDEIFAQTLLHTVKQRNKMGVVEKFYTVDVLTVYHTYLPKIINVALNLPKLLLKNLLFCGHSVENHISLLNSSNANDLE